MTLNALTQLLHHFGACFAAHAPPARGLSSQADQCKCRKLQVVGRLVETSSEASLMPALEQRLAAFPFRILAFHSDNGLESINIAPLSHLSSVLRLSGNSDGQH